MSKMFLIFIVIYRRSEGFLSSGTKKHRIFFAEIKETTVLNVHNNAPINPESPVRNARSSRSDTASALYNHYVDHSITVYLPHVRNGASQINCATGERGPIFIHYNTINIGNVHQLMSLRKPPYGEIFSVEISSKGGINPQGRIRRVD